MPPLKLPEFKDGEDVDEFLDHFDQAAEASGVSDANKVLFLSNSLTGKAREAFNNLNSPSYLELTDALRKRFRLDAEAYRNRFRNMRKSGNETFPQFAQRLRRILGFWERMAGQDLKEMVLMEQMFCSISPEVTIFVREQKPATLDAAAEAAETYVGARTSRSREGSGPWSSNRNQHKPVKPGRASSLGRQEYRPGLSGADRSKALAAGECFICRKTGHMARDCTKFSGGRGNNSALSQRKQQK